MNFTELKIPRPFPKEVLKALAAMAFETPTPIQALAIPVASEGKDLIAIAETGTGKTGAFALPMISRLLENPNELALILAPTRELAIQIEDFMRKLTQYTRDLRSVNLVGGLPMGAQVRALNQRPRIIIATPGRLLDHMERGSVQLSRVSVLVLDEADRMLDMGFQPQLERIRKALPQRRQTLLFSATWGKEMDQLSSKYLHMPARVGTAKESKASPNIAQKAMNLSQQKKNETLLDELNRREGSILVFARTQARVDRVTKFLASYGVDASRIHGGRSQAQRNGALASFKDGRTRFLIATDIAARGIDVTGIGHVINYDLPQVAEDYVHRIGRTGRNGLSGESVSFITPEDRGNWRDIVRLLQKSGSKLPEVLAAPDVTLPERPAMTAARPTTGIVSSGSTHSPRYESNRMPKPNGTKISLSGNSPRRDTQARDSRSEREFKGPSAGGEKKAPRGRRWGQPASAAAAPGPRNGRRFSGGATGGLR